MVRSPAASLQWLRNSLCGRLTPKKRLRTRHFRRMSQSEPTRDMEMAANTTQLSIERRSLHPETGGLQPGDDIVDRLRIARLALDLDHCVLGGQPSEDAAVVDLDDVDPGFIDLARDRGERPRLVVGKIGRAHV